jgi:hypothetical protein
MKTVPTILLVIFVLVFFTSAQNVDLTGTVTNEANNAPLKDVTVTLKYFPSLTCLTDSSGKYHLSGITAALPQSGHTASQCRINGNFLEYSVTGKSPVEIEAFTISGAKVRTLVSNRHQSQGCYYLNLSAQMPAANLYLIRYRQGSDVAMFRYIAVGTNHGIARTNINTTIAKLSKSMAIAIDTLVFSISGFYTTDLPISSYIGTYNVALQQGGSAHYISLRSSLNGLTSYTDGTLGLPCIALVTDINGNPVPDGTEVIFTCKISGAVSKRPVANFFNASPSYYCYSVTIDTINEILPFEDFNDNFRCDSGEDRNGDSVAGRGPDIDGDGILSFGPPYEDINQNGKRDYLPGDVVEPWRPCGPFLDSAGYMHRDTVFADFNGNGIIDHYEPLTGLAETMSDSEYTALLNYYKATHHGKNYDIDKNHTNVGDPNTAVFIKRSVLTSNGKALNEVIYNQSDATHLEVMIWAKCQGITPPSPEKVILPSK